METRHTIVCVTILGDVCTAAATAGGTDFAASYTGAAG